MSGLSDSSWRNARPFAAPSIILILTAHGRGVVNPVNIQHYYYI
jgi:hypothetical protein